MKSLMKPLYVQSYVFSCCASGRFVRALFAVVVAVSLSVQAGCQLLTGVTEEDTTPQTLLLALAGMSQFSVNFSPVVGSQTVSCSTSGVANTYTLGGSAGTSIKDLRLYVSNVRLVSAGGEAPLSLTSDGANQGSGVALLDFEDATGNCAGTSQTNTRISGTVAPGSYTALRFSVGVPVASNHTDATAGDTPAPLNVAGMYWSWTGGRKFMRFELVNGGNTSLFHLGSTGCSGTAPNITCAKANRAEVEVAVGNGGTVKLDLPTLFSHANWGIASNPTCHSAQAVCGDIFPKLGLSFADGSASAAAQSAFGAM